MAVGVVLPLKARMVVAEAVEAALALGVQLTLALVQ